MINRKAETPCPGATSIRQASEKVVLYLLDGLTYDLELLGVSARQRKAETPCPGATSIRQASEKVALYLLDGLA